MKDSVSLLLAALCASLSAWLFWHFTGSSGFEILSILVMMTLFIENLHLRRKLKEFQLNR
jgi:hypothetical protein